MTNSSTATQVDGHLADTTTNSSTVTQVDGRLARQFLFCERPAADTDPETGTDKTDKAEAGTNETGATEPEPESEADAGDKTTRQDKDAGGARAFTAALRHAIGRVARQHERQVSLHRGHGQHPQTRPPPSTALRPALLLQPPATLHLRCGCLAA